MELGAAIDIGSNTTRLAIGKYDIDKNEISIKDRSLFQTRLSEGFEASGSLSSSAIERTLNALCEIKTKIEEYNIAPAYIAAATTGVVREAENRDLFCRSILERTGLSVDILGGEEEAKTIAAGVLASMSKIEFPLLICDVGGGSTEIVRVDKKKQIFAFSCPMGVVRLTERCGEMVDKLKTCITEQLNLCPAKSEKIAQLIATAGTPTTLAAIDLQMQVYNPVKIHGYWLAKENIDSMFSAMSSLSVMQRRFIPGMPKGREDIILAGTIILQTMLNNLELPGLTVSDASLLEGLLIHIFAATGYADIKIII